MRFSATLPGEGIAGLYRAVAQEGGVVTHLAGWVVLRDGQRGAMIDRRPRPRIVSTPLLDLTTLTAEGLGGVTLRAEKVTGFIGNDIEP